MLPGHTLALILTLTLALILTFNRDKANFYIMARGSLLETKNHITYGQKVGYFLEEQVVSLGNQIDEIWKEINSLLAFLENSLKPALNRPQPRPKASARS